MLKIKRPTGAFSDLILVPESTARCTKQQNGSGCSHSYVCVTSFCHILLSTESVPKRRHGITTFVSSEIERLPRRGYSAKRLLLNKSLNLDLRSSEKICHGGQITLLAAWRLWRVFTLITWHLALFERIEKWKVIVFHFFKKERKKIFALLSLDSIYRLLFLEDSWVKWNCAGEKWSYLTRLAAFFTF